MRRGALLRSVAARGAALLLLVALPAHGVTGSFVFDGRACAVGCSAGRCITRCRTVSGGLAFASDGTYRVPGGSCPLGQGEFPDEVGLVTAGKRGWLVLLPSNLADLQQAVFDCLSQQYDVTLVRIQSYRTRVKIAADGQSLRGIHRDHARARIQGHTVDAFDVAHFRGTRTAGSVAGALLDGIGHGLRAALSDP